ncbi:MAG: hypothetical protein DRP64_07745 [Verrucomicrobia bacterium]|nr:MAG: hypothetical protein DRP64_07745 [Verrucomicrobiota bacterium]
MGRGKGEKMKKVCLVICVLSIATFASATLLTHTGTVTPTELGGTLTTDLPEFDNSLGTLTDVTITFNLTFTPYAKLISVGGDGVFLPSQSISYSYTDANILTLSHGTDSWSLPAPTVGTGIIYGSNQTVPALPATLKLSVSNAAPLNWSDSGVNLTEYIGTGTLSFDTDGVGNVSVSAGTLFGGGGADLTGTASVDYEYVIPEPATLAMISLFSGGILFMRRYQFL